MSATASHSLNIHILAASSPQPTEPLTRAVFYRIKQRIPRLACRYTTSPQSFERFELTDQQILTFHELNASPPAISVKVIETFRKRIAKD
jgi:hypothetical protein